MRIFNLFNDTMGTSQLIIFAFLGLLSSQPAESDMAHADGESDHAFYVAVIKLKHQPEDSVISISITLFTDDLQAALRDHLDLQSELQGVNLCGAYQSGIRGYLLAHLSVKINDTPADVSFETCNESLDTHILEGSIYGQKDLSKIEITADFLIDLFPTQVNMVYVDNGLTSRMARLDQQSPSAVLVLNR